MSHIGGGFEILEKLKKTSDRLFKRKASKNQNLEETRRMGMVT